MPMEMDTTDLIARARASDHNAFRELVEVHGEFGRQSSLPTWLYIDRLLAPSPRREITHSPTPLAVCLALLFRRMLLYPLHCRRQRRSRTYREHVSAGV
jgi:hypothetical protein